MSKACIICGKRAYSDYCFQHKPKKRITQKGPKTIEYEAWRDEVARPYLDKHFGRVCASCGGTRCGNNQLDVDHKLKRGSRADLKMDLDNVQYLGRYPCHFEKDNT